MRILVVACLLVAVLAAPGVAASPPHSDCDHGVVLGGSFTGYCGEAPDCMVLYVQDRWIGTIGCR